MIAYDKYPNQEMADKLGVKLVSQEEVLKKADIISIHLPATDETKHLINQETLNKMKDGVYVVNTARGSIVSEKDMAEALRTGKVAGFASDVFETEPIDLSGFAVWL